MDAGCMTRERTSKERTFGYYWAAVVPVAARACGFERHKDGHRHMMAGWFDMQMDDPALPSFGTMPDEERHRYIDWAIRQLAEMDCEVDEPLRRTA